MLRPYATAYGTAVGSGAGDGSGASPRQLQAVHLALLSRSATMRPPQLGQGSGKGRLHVVKSHFG